ncbi:MAG: Crp/Fnr family transcriptional regulator [Armatimonadetes bacterium]|nr:Crp/Fnr family transcriptional regulator [Armatimonadota bacterium]
MKTGEAISARRILESSTVFNSLTEDQIQHLASSSKITRAAKGETIWLTHQDVGFFGLVGDGFVKMVRLNCSGQDVILEIMGPGQPFGLLGVIDGLGCPLMACALTDLIYLRIGKSSILEVYTANHVLKDRLLKKTALRMHQKLDYISKLSSGRTEERIAAVLFILADSYGRKTGKSVTIGVPLTRQQIGEMAGTTTETTIRIFSRWTNDAILETEQQFLTILDPVRLEARLNGSALV